MNSTSTRKRRRKVIASRRRLNSTANKSLSLSNLGNSKRRIIALLKNNKNLALAVQDARCELSTKQKLLENATKHFKNIMQARMNMLEMYSSLKSIMKNFDDTLQLLKVDDTKISDLTAPFQSVSKFKSQMRKLAESVEEVSEEDSFSVEQEKISDDNDMIKKSSNQVIPSTCNSNIDSVLMEVAEGSDEMRTNFEAVHDPSVQDCVENTGSVISKNITDMANPMPPISFCENSEGVRYPCKEKQISPTKSDSLKDRESSGTPKLSIPNITSQGVIDPYKEKQISPTKSDSLKDRESSGTPKLSIPNIVPLINSKLSSNFKTCLPNEKSSSVVENPSKVLNSSVLPSQKVWSSKIPRFHDIPVRAKRKSNSPAVASKGKTLYENIVQKILGVPEESDLNFCRRKTFVVKNCDASNTNPESTVTLNQEEVLTENNSDVVEDSEVMSRRKTFVVKNSDVLENKCKSLCDRRKTFVKKTEGKNKARKSAISGRNTFVLSEIKENCMSTNQNVNSVTENSVADIIQKKSCLHSNETEIAEELPSVCNNISESTENSEAPQKKSVCSETSDTKIIPPENHCQGERTMKEANESTQKVEESKPGKDNSNVEDLKEDTLKIRNFNEIVVTLNRIDQKREVEISDFDATCQDNIQCAIESGDDIEILDTNENVNSTRSCKRISYKEFLESSDSDCEPISDLDMQFLKTESPIKSFPIRGKISESKKKKVFVFNAHKRKSVLKKKSLGKLPKISENNSNMWNECNDALQSDSASVKNDVNTFRTQIKEKLNKNVTFDCTAKIYKNETTDDADCYTPCDRQEMLQSTASVKNKTKNARNVKVKNLDKTSELIVSKSEINTNKNILSYNSYSPVITSDKSLDTIECESDNLNLNSKNSTEEHDTYYLSNETKPNIKNDKKVKNSKVKSHPLKNEIPVDDIISLKKSVKRNNSKKKSKEVITSGLREENASDLMVKNEREVKTRRKNNKTRVKNKKKSPINMTETNTIIVQAEIHPPPRFVNIPEIEVLDKENKEKLDPENFEVSVVLSDIFQSKNIDMLTLSCKDKLISEGRNFPSKTPLSDNSSNIVIPVRDNDNGKKEGSIASSFEENQTSKRIRKLNYAEPSLRKKMRR